MDAITYTQARGNFAETMNKVCDDHAPIIITRQNKPPIVMMSLEDYNSIEETLYLLRSPKNAARLMSSLRSYESGKLTEKQLIE